MLRDGKFIKEPPPKIGVHYLPTKVHMDITPEEFETQEVLIGHGVRAPNKWKEMLIGLGLLFLFSHLVLAIVEG